MPSTSEILAERREYRLSMIRTGDRESIMNRRDETIDGNPVDIFDGKPCVTGQFYKKAGPAMQRWIRDNCDRVLNVDVYLLPPPLHERVN